MIGHRLKAWLIEPSARLEEPDARQRARLFAIGALLLIVGELSGLLLAPFMWPALVPMGALLVFAYALGRSRHYRVGAFLAMLVCVLHPVPNMLVRGIPLHGEIAFLEHAPWLVLAPMLTSVWFSVGAIILVTLLEVVVLVLLTVYLLGSPEPVAQSSLLFLLITGFLTVLAARVREQDRQRVAAQAQQLLESDARYRELFDASVEAMAVCDEGRIVEVNPAFERLFRCRATEAKDQPLAVFVDQALAPSDGAAASIEGSGIRITGRELAVESIGRRPDGASFPVELRRATGRQLGERIVDVVGLRDISAHKRIEATLVEAKELAEAAARAKTTFLTSMSHELRTPMNAIIGMTGLLLDGPLASAQRDYVETIREGGDALLTIINDILDYAQMESGTLRLDCERFDLYRCVESAAELVAAQAAAKQLELDVFLDPALPSFVYGDEARLRQILVEILSNALKFTERGLVRLVAAPGEAPASGGGDRAGAPGADDTAVLSFHVSDTGIGISNAQQADLFQSFRQLDGSRSRSYGGTGLGLAICRYLAEHMGGAIAVDSELGAGATFHVVVRLPADRSATAPYLVASPRLAGRRLLLGEGNAAVRASLRRMAEHWGMEVREAEHLRQLEDSASGPAAVALVAETLPGLDAAGEDIGGQRDALIAAVRAVSGDASLAVVPMGFDGEARGEGGGEPGADQAQPLRLSKPVGWAALRRALDQAVGVRSEVGVAAALQPVARARSASEGLRILVAEDNLVNQRLMRLLLGRLGYRADVVANGREVLDAVRRQRYDVILMDLHMPEMDGMEATSLIRSTLGADSQPRIIAVTADALDETQERCRAVGMDACLTKPVMVDQLTAALSQA
ncbi:response regulator [Haliangium ochraceum]|uniref:Sensory/regulatory protein RpfC n=1 Tax=Haliangium ochraceum (strain DSM 14365 / JCM 11303 / SMP-2) TaxID=502025 RepID=D0LSG0_HALO1|nr:response regulator [Haliangium ochraceum]ACY15659.1 multi-sensor hybrid histidine kinase [Haliangium ochraceum DSM 14365]